MKKRGRVEIQIERREFSLFAASGEANGAGVSGLNGQPASESEFAACPTCGACEMFLLAGAVELAGVDLSALEKAMESGGVHLHQAASGQWWICKPSLPRS